MVTIMAVEGQYVGYTFYRVDPAWRRLPVEERAAHKDAFAEAVEHFAPRFDHLRCYSLAGTRPDADFFLWKITDRYADLGELAAALNATPLAGWLATPYSYLRQRAMEEHIRIGREEFPGIKNHTTYSFGIDDQEFMTAFECDEPADFMHLMLRLRDSEASRYTERDTPIFVGTLVDVRAALDELDGAATRVEL
jgi:chlorite dismutase